MVKIPVSVVISAFNEERHIKRVLDSVSWAEEVIVVDNESTDATATLAKKSGARVITRPNNLMLNKNKNAGFEEAKNEWILNLDADEAVTPELEKELHGVVNLSSGVDGYWIPRKNIIFGKWIQHGLWWPDKQLRLFRKGKGVFPCIHVHEYITVTGETKDLSQPIEHLNYETISQFFTKLNTIYTENEAAIRDERQIPFSWHQFIREPVTDFINVYYARQGYKDGLHGLVLSYLQGIYAFAVVAKRWERRGFTSSAPSLSEVQKELVLNNKDATYWHYTSKIAEEKNVLYRFFYRLLRKYASIH
jgi:glycosyltransferase involved in cell wall biosynthesis